mgnify:CR=1 FL=1
MEQIALGYQRPKRLPILINLHIIITQWIGSFLALTISKFFAITFRNVFLYGMGVLLFVFSRESILYDHTYSRA